MFKTCRQVFLFSFFFLLILVFSYQIQVRDASASFSQEPVTSPAPFGVNDVIYTTARDGNTLYVGGAFNYAGSVAPYVNLISKTTGLPVLDLPQIEDPVTSAISDGAGGWYVGSFKNNNGVNSVGRLSHIFEDGTLDADFNIVLNEKIQALFLDGTTLYIGGYFSEVGGEIRNRLAAINTTTGTVTAFNPGVDNAGEYVGTLLIDGTTLYIGGYFSEVGGEVRTGLAAIDTTTGLVTAFDVSAVSSIDSVETLLLDGTTLYIGGEFSEIGGEARNNLAAVDTTTGLVTDFNPDVNSMVFSLSLDGTTLYIGGTFTQAGGEARTGLAAIDTTTGLVTAFDANVTGIININTNIRALFLDGTTLYIGGTFTQAGGEERLGLAGIDTATGLATAFDTSTYFSVSSIVGGVDSLFIGSQRTLTDVQTRTSLVAFNLETGLVTDFDADINIGGYVQTLLLDGTTLYIGGNFTNIGGEIRNRLAAIDTTTGTVTAFDVGVNANSVQAMILDGTTLYIGGDFFQIDGEVRNKLAAIDTTTGLATAFNAGIIDQEIKTLRLYGTTLYIGGYFTQVGGEARTGLAAIDTTTGLVTAFDAGLDSSVKTLLLDGTTLYIGGYFTQAGGEIRNYLAAIDTTTGLATIFDAGLDNGVETLLLDGTTLYIGGYFSQAGGQARTVLAGIDTTTSLATAFNAGVVGDVQFLMSGVSLIASGNLVKADSTVISGIAIFNNIEDTVVPEPVPEPEHRTISGSAPRRVLVLNSNPNPVTNVVTPISTNNIVKLNRILRRGVIGEDVRSLQKKLNEKGYLVAKSGAGSVGKETNLFGLLTRMAVIKFQKSKGLVADGIVGPLTQIELEK